MDSEIVVALIGIVPQLVVITAVGVIGFRYRAPISDAIETRLTGVSLFGVAMTLQPRDVNRAVAEREHRDASAPDAASVAEPPEGDAVAARAQSLSKQLVGRTILWVDDHQEWLVTERRLVRALGIFVEPASTNDEALRVLADALNGIDLVISDIGRDAGPSGLELGPRIATTTGQPLIYYVGRLQSDRPPPGSIGITNRPDKLLDLIMDAVERLPARGGVAPFRRRR